MRIKSKINLPKQPIKNISEEECIESAKDEAMQNDPNIKPIES